MIRGERSVSLVLAACAAWGVLAPRAVAGPGPSPEPSARVAGRPGPGAAASRAAVAARPVRAHPGPPVFLELSLEGVMPRAFLHGEQRVLAEWLGFEAPLAPDSGEEVRARLLAAAAAGFPALGTLTLDGTAAEPTALGVQILGPFAGSYGEEPSLVFELGLGARSQPRTVEVLWTRFAEDTRGGGLRMPVHLRAEGAFDYVVLLPEEPAWTWHAPTERGLDLAPAALAASAVGAGGAPSGDGLPLLLLATAGGLGAVLLHRGRRAPGLGALLAGGALCVAWVVAGPSRIAVPTGDAARALHEELLRRVYAGFDATTEQGVFRALRSSVTPELLEPLYQGIHESLVMADEGGAVCRVESLEILGAEPRPRAAAAGASFTVEADWRVDGRVIHFGHEHARRTRYRGEVTISAERTQEGPPAWRISGLEVREQIREPLPEGAGS